MRLVKLEEDYQEFNGPTDDGGAAVGLARVGRALCVLAIAVGGLLVLWGFSTLSAGIGQ